jgi:REP element-mobilizing transposase RayT
MILACHLVWTAYGWWFPNDPRGSWSKELWVPAIRELGNESGNMQRGRQRVQPSPVHLREWLKKAQGSLKHMPVTLDMNARKVVRNAINEQVDLHDYIVPAIAVRADHVHVIVRRHCRHTFQRMVQAFKSVSTRALHKHFLLADLPARREEDSTATKDVRNPVWSRGYWMRYLDNDEAIAIATAYVKRQA